MAFDQHLGRILSLSNIDHFSAVEIRTAYIVLKNDEQMDKSDARRFVYSELLKLVNLGWLKKMVSTKKNITSYVKTDLFDVNVFDVQPEYEQPSSNNVEKVNLIKQSNIDSQLIDRLQGYKTELLEGLGVIDECKSLRLQLPNMHDSLQLKYNEVRETNARLLGKIKLLESFIKSNADE